MPSIYVCNVSPQGFGDESPLLAPAMNFSPTPQAANAGGQATGTPHAPARTTNRPGGVKRAEQPLMLPTMRFDKHV